MRVTRIDGADQTDDVEQREYEHYLPAAAGLSTEPGPVERILKTIFRRRGDVRTVVRRRDR